MSVAECNQEIFELLYRNWPRRLLGSPLQGVTSNASLHFALWQFDLLITTFGDASHSPLRSEFCA